MLSLSFSTSKYAARQVIPYLSTKAYITEDWMIRDEHILEL